VAVRTEQGVLPGPFMDASWRADLGLLAEAGAAAARAWAAEARVLVSLAERVPRSPGDERGGTAWTSFLREVAVVKRISDRAAVHEVHLADALLARFPVLLAELDAGSAPVHRARLLVELCGRHPDAVASVADRLLAPRLRALAPWMLKHEVAQLALRLDPEGGARREAVATASRTASKQALDDGQAEVALTGPAVLVQRWWDALTDQARRLKAAGDARSLGALRFDLAVHTDPRGLLGHDALAAAVGVPTPVSARQDAAGGREREPDRTAEDVPAGSRGDVAGADGPPAAAGAGRAAGTGPGGPGPGPGTLAGREGGSGVDARCARPVQVRVTVPAATALGLLDEPGWLDGHGWISAPLSRTLLTCAELRKAVVAPHSGQLVDLGDRVERPNAAGSRAASARETVRRMVLADHELRPAVTDVQEPHDPSPALEAFVHARDRWCDGPTGAQVPAARSDTDHDTAWPHGPTAAWNLVSRSARTHQLKHHGWRPQRVPTGTSWTSPAGQECFTPRLDHPPVAPPPGARPPDPQELAARDRALVTVPEWPAAWDRPEDDRPVDDRPEDDRPVNDQPVDDRPEPHAQAPLPAATGPARRAWPDPGF
jgi:hypothetical protein